MSLYGILTADDSSQQTKDAATKKEAKPSLPSGWASGLSIQPALIRRPPAVRKPARPASAAFPGASFNVVKPNPNAEPDTRSESSEGKKPATSSENYALSNSGKGPPAGAFGGVKQHHLTPLKVAHKFNEKRKNGGKGFQRREAYCLDDDYDPSRPNGYEEYKAARKKQKEKQGSDSLGGDGSNFNHIPPPNNQRRDFDDDASRDVSPSRRSGFMDITQQQQTTNTVQPPPPNASAQLTLTAASGEEAYLARARLRGANKPPIATPPIAPVAPTKPTIEKRSKVVLLTNMVGPGEVDDTLQEETAEECSKYGVVQRCLIYELPGDQVPPEKAVRIFVQFALAEFAEKAYNDLNGRFFGGRSVTARFYDEARFLRLDLAPTRAELQEL